MYYKNCFSGYIIRENQLKKSKKRTKKLILRQGFTQTLTPALHHKKKPLYPAVQGNLSYISQKQELSYPFSSIMRLSSRHPVWILLTTVEQLIPVRQAISRYDIRSQYRILISSCICTGMHESCSARQNSASSYPSGMPEGYEEALFCLAEQLSCMPVQMQELIKMRYWERMSYREIACRTGINCSTVVKRIQTGCRELRRMMEEKGYDSSCFWEI